MRRLLLFAVLVTTALPAAAQFIDDTAFPLSNTRYGPAAVPARPVTASNGRDFLLVWWTADSIRVTKVVAGDARARVGRPVLPAEAGQIDEPAIIWTGSRYLVASNSGGRIVGRFLASNGEPIGDTFTILGSGYGPRLATNGSRILMLYRPRELDGEVRSVVLSLDGAVLGPDELVAKSEGIQLVRWYAATSNGTNFATIAGARAGVVVSTFTPAGALASYVDVAGALSISFLLRRPVAIASNGSRYLAVWADPGQPLRGVLVEANGAFTSTANIDTPAKGTDVIEAPTVAWDGGRYDVAWIYGGAIRTAQVDPNGGVSAGQSTPARGFAWPSLAAAGGRTMLAWAEQKTNTFGGVVHVREVGDLRFASEGYVASWSAAEQVLIAAVAGSDSTIVVWIERTAEGEATWYGVRGRDGSWTEQRIAPEARTAHVATDGRNFMIVTNAPTGALATHVSSEGTTLEPLALTGLTPAGVAWNGSHYAVIGYDSGQNTIVSLFTPTSVTARNVLIRNADPSRVGDPAITSDGRDFLIAWLTPGTLHAARYDSALLRIDEMVLQFSGGNPTEVDAAWNGSNYGVAVVDNGQVRLYRIPSRGAALAPVTVYEALGRAQRDVSIESIDGRFAIAWREPATETNRGALVNNDGTIASALTLDTGHASSSGPVLLAAPGGLTAYVASIANGDAPHHGAERVMMRVDAPAPKPGAPRLQAGVVGESIQVEWTLPTGLVHGYRLQYRVGDGTWNELEGWFAPSDRSITLSGLPRHASYAFRVSAWSDAGAGPYSNEVTVVLGGKVRAVR